MESQNMEQKKANGRIKPKFLKDSALAAGLDALKLLESSDVATRQVQMTAKTLIVEGIDTIMRLRARGVPLLRIYNDLKKAAGLKISFQTFSSYVCEVAKEKGLRLDKKKTAPRPAASPAAGTVAVQDQAQTQTVDHEKSSWNCEHCSTDSKRHESTKNPGKFFWKCARCGTFYADNAGTMTDQKL